MSLFLCNYCFWFIPEAYRQNPRLVWEFYNYRREIVLNREPNPGHYAITEIQKYLVTSRQIDLDIITQNVDNLHRRAGSKNIFKLHGDIMSVRCHNCGSSIDTDPLNLSPIDSSFRKYEEFNDDLFSGMRGFWG